MGEIIEKIITIVAGLVAGGAVTTLFTLGSSRRKAKAEAKGSEIDNSQELVVYFKSAMGVLNEQLDRLNVTIKEKDALIERKEAEKSHYLMRLQSLYDDMCVHKGCKVRLPHQGMGGEWYESHKNDPNLGCDFLSIETLLKQWREKNKDKDD